MPLPPAVQSLQTSDNYASNLRLHTPIVSLNIFRIAQDNQSSCESFNQANQGSDNQR